MGCLTDTVSQQVPHTSSLSAAGFPALWLHTPSSSPAPSAFWSSSTVACELLPLFSSKLFVLGRAICFLSFLYAVAELCTAWESCSPESLFAVRRGGKFFHQVWQRFAVCESCSAEALFAACPDGKMFIRLLLGFPCWGSPLLAHLPRLWHSLASSAGPW